MSHIKETFITIEDDTCLPEFETGKPVDEYCEGEVSDVYPVDDSDYCATVLSLETLFDTIQNGTTFTPISVSLLKQSYQAIGLETDQLLDDAVFISNPEQAKTITLENLSEVLKEIWGKIVASIKKLVKSFVEFYQRQALGFRRVKKELIDIKERVSLVEGKKPNEPTMEIGFLTRFYYDGEASLSSLETGLKNLIPLHDFMFNEFRKNVLEFYSEIESRAKKFNPSDSEPEQAFMGIYEDMNRVIFRLDNKNLIGGKRIILKERETRLGKVSLPYFDKIQGVESIDNHGEIEVADKRQLMDLLKYCEEIISTRLQFEFLESDLQKAIDKSMKSIDKMVDGFEKEPEKSASVKKAINDAMNTQSIDYSRPIGQVSQQAFTAIRSVIMYCEMCLKNY